MSSKPKILPVRKVPSKVDNQYKHLHSLTIPKDKAIFLTRMGFTPKQICKKLNISLKACIEFVKGIENNKLGVFI